MSDNRSKQITLLAHKIRVLEEENIQLAERAEDSLLISLITANIQNLSERTQTFERCLEQIAILKAIPFVTCGAIVGNQLKPIASYCAFSDQADVGYPIALGPETLMELALGPVIISADDGLSCHFENFVFRPLTIAIIPFETQEITSGVFVFMDDTPEENRLAPMLMLLTQVVDMAATRYDNLFLIEALTRANKDLEARVLHRTRDLTAANEKLEREMAERVASEKALKASHQTLLTVLNSIDASINVVDLETYRILFMNKHMIDVFGQEFSGRLCFEAFRKVSAPCKACKNAQLLDHAGHPRDVVIWQDKNPITGGWYVNYDRAIKWTDGRMVRLQIATDITQLKAMESQLQQAQKMEAIGTLAGGIAHDFNNLLMAILGHVSLVSAEIEPMHPSREHITVVEEHIRSAMGLTKQLLGFARGGKYEVKPVDINSLLVDSATLFGRTHKELRIQTNVGEAPLVVDADRRQIEQVFLNLFINAWQAMPEGGALYLRTVRVSLDRERCEAYQIQPGEFTHIAITDTGTGMDEDICPRIFDPFFTTKDKGRGTGLGLASAYGIVKNHGGTITVDSELGHGTTFNIFLPLSDKKAYREPPLEDKLLKGAETILLVDDEDMILNVGQAILKKLGYKVVAAKGGEQALEVVRKAANDIDLVILDLIMPGMDGGTTFDCLRSLRKDLPVLLSSGYAIDGQANDIIQRGCNGFIQKPFNMTELSIQVRKILDASAAVEE
ncbi:MAG: response regulator [Desulfobacterales bacterium]|nr:response regulator [Desulfobacterales bacterium]